MQRAARKAYVGYLMKWFEAVQKLESKNQNYVLITVLGTKGSTPRDCGTKMVVSQSKIYQTIGGGNLEYQAIDRARKLLL